MNLLEALWVSAAAPNVKQSWLLNTLTPPPSWAENTGFTVCCSGGFHPGTFWCLSWCLSTSHTITGTNYERCFALIILFGSRWGVQSRVKSWLVHQAARRYRMFWEARGRRKGGMKRWASRPKSAESQRCHGNPAARCSGEVLEHGVHFGEAEVWKWLHESRKHSFVNLMKKEIRPAGPEVTATDCRTRTTQNEHIKTIKPLIFLCFLHSQVGRGR